MKKILILFITFITIKVNAQEGEVIISTEKLTDNIYVLKGRGGNIGVFVGENEVFMIDDQFAPLTQKILSAIKQITPKPVTYLVNTHWHGDHTGGNLNMQKEGATIISHKNVRKRMSTNQFILGRDVPASPKEALPILTFSEDMQLYLNGEEIMVTHIHNAHTDGDALVYFINSNVLHVGDAYFQGKFPFIDINSGGSIDGYIKGIEKMLILADNDTKIIPGHGNVANKKELKEYLKMLLDVKEIILNEKRKGVSLEEIKKDEKLIQKYKSFNGWITEDKIKEAVYKSLK